jgi:hypothetical protein
MAKHNPKSEKTVWKYVSQTKIHIQNVAKKGIFFLKFKNCKKIPNPKQRICNQLFLLKKNYYYYLHLCKITEKVAELRFGDFKRCIKKGSKSTPTSNKYQDKIYKIK